MSTARLPTTTAATAPAAPAASTAPVEKEVGGAREGVADDVSSAIRAQVVDTTGRPRPNVPVVFSGPESYRLVTDSSGLVAADVVAGFYDVAVPPGCADDVEVTGGASAEVYAPPGQVAEGELAIGWRRRFAPDTEKFGTRYEPADGSGNQDSLARWRPDTPYVVSFTVVDRCGGTPAPGASIDVWRAAGSDNLTILEQSTGADDAAIGRVHALCSGSGVIRLTLSDPENPAEPPADLLARSNQGYGRPSCGG